MTDGLLRQPQRVRHALKFRRASVARVEPLTPVLKRIILEGEELEGFFSPGFDDHVKIFPVPRGQGQGLVLPTVGPKGPVFAEPRPVARDYTPRAFDAGKRQLTIDFAVGHGGPATAWAEAAQVGDELGLGGPRGSFLVPTSFAEHLLVGDETAIPAIARRLEELPSGAHAIACIEVADTASEIEMATEANVEIVWVHRNGGPRGRPDALIAAAVAAAQRIDPADAYVWVACESSVARAMRPALLAARRFNPKWMKVAGYWRRDAAGQHEVIEG